MSIADVAKVPLTKSIFERLSSTPTYNCRIRKNDNRSITLTKPRIKTTRDSPEVVKTGYKSRRNKTKLTKISGSQKFDKSHNQGAKTKITKEVKKNRFLVERLVTRRVRGGPENKEERCILDQKTEKTISRPQLREARCQSNTKTRLKTKRDPLTISRDGKTINRNVEDRLSTQRARYKSQIRRKGVTETSKERSHVHPNRTISKNGNTRNRNIEDTSSIQPARFISKIRRKGIAQISKKRSHVHPNTTRSKISTLPIYDHKSDLIELSTLSKAKPSVLKRDDEDKLTDDEMNSNDNDFQLIPLVKNDGSHSQHSEKGAGTYPSNKITNISECPSPTIVISDKDIITNSATSSTSSLPSGPRQVQNDKVPKHSETHFDNKEIIQAHKRIEKFCIEPFLQSIDYVGIASMCTIDHSIPSSLEPSVSDLSSSHPPSILGPDVSYVGKWNKVLLNSVSNLSSVCMPSFIASQSLVTSHFPKEINTSSSLLTESAVKLPLIHVNHHQPASENHQRNQMQSGFRSLAAHYFSPTSAASLSTRAFRNSDYSSLSSSMQFSFRKVYKSIFDRPVTALNTCRNRRNEGKSNNLTENIENKLVAQKVEKNSHYQRGRVRHRRIGEVRKKSTRKLDMIAHRDIDHPTATWLLPQKNHHQSDIQTRPIPKETASISGSRTTAKLTGARKIEEVLSTQPTRFRSKIRSKVSTNKSHVCSKRCEKSSSTACEQHSCEDFRDNNNKAMISPLPPPQNSQLLPPKEILIISESKLQSIDKRYDSDNGRNMDVQDQNIRRISLVGNVRNQSSSPPFPRVGRKADKESLDSIFPYLLIASSEFSNCSLSELSSPLPSVDAFQDEERGIDEDTITSISSSDNSLLSFSESSLLESLSSQSSEAQMITKKANDILKKYKKDA